jgi:hypothetical protein
VLKQVLNTYNYTSLPELNAVLKGFGVMADRGNKDSFTYRQGGLLYRLLDNQGVPTGVPIKASTITGKPTLKDLEKRFEENKFNREILRLSLQVTIDKIVNTQSHNLDTLIAALAKENIVVVLRQNDEGRIYGITFVDHKNKSVFNGSEIGKAYSIAGLYKQFSRKPEHTRHLQQSIGNTLAEQLLLPENELTETPRELNNKRKKKKRKL